MKRPTLVIVIRYVLLQLPGLAAFVVLLLLIRQWLEFPRSVLWGLIGIWVSKDIVLFPLLFRFYDPHPPDRFGMAGRRGVAMTRLNPQGYVKVQGERWQAHTAAGAAAIEEGAAICVEAAEGLQLTVRACPENQNQSSSQ